MSQYFIFLHIVFMFAGVAAADGAGFLVFRMAQSRDLAAIRAGYRLYEPIARISTILFLLGLAFGLISIFTVGFNPFEPWLIIAYVLFIIQVVLGVAVVDRWHARVTELAAAPDADPNYGELAATLNQGTARTVAILQSALVVVFIFDMVVKPFSGR